MFKQIFKKVIIQILTWEAQIVLKRFKPQIIALTGSVGKTSTKDAIYTAMKDHVRVRKNQKSFNSEIGTPLTILGLPTGWSNPIIWLQNIAKGFLVIFSSDYPDWLILEVGVDRPGDIERVGKWLQPHIVVLTSFPDVPVHVEFFASPQAVIAEKKMLVTAMQEGGSLILNADDEQVMRAGEMVRPEQITSVGFADIADIAISDMDYAMFDNGAGEKMIGGISWKLQDADYEGRMRLAGALGKQYVYPLSMAYAVAKKVGIAPEKIIASLQKHEPTNGRMKLLPTKFDGMLIDDSYNASPISMQAAINELAQQDENTARIAILGTMAELGNFSQDEHVKIGKLLTELSVDGLITIGAEAKYIYDEFISGHEQNDIQNDSIFHFDNVADCLSFLDSKKLNNHLKGATILVKGSQSSRTDRISAWLLDESLNPLEELVRQEGVWEGR